jgi:hypothetical protein
VHFCYLLGFGLNSPPEYVRPFLLFVRGVSAGQNRFPEPGHIAGCRKTPVLDNRTAYHGIFEYLRLSTGFELPSSWLIGSCYGTIPIEAFFLMSWTHIDLGAQDLNGIQRPNHFSK